MELAQITQLVESRQRGRDGSAREIRLRAGKSMAEVGALVGVSESAISRWETGDRQPRGQAAEKWARLLVEWAGGSDHVDGLAGVAAEHASLPQQAHSVLHR